MDFLILPKESWSSLVGKLQKEFRIFGPQAIDDEFIFEELGSSNVMALDYTISILPPKKVITPQYENLFAFDAARGLIAAMYDPEPTIIIGVHTCDLHAINLLDSAFLGGNKDPHYLARRENTTIISIECLTPCSEHSFCKDMGTLSHPERFDLHLTPIGASYAVEIGSTKGEELLKKMDSLRSADEKDTISFDNTLAEKQQSFPNRLSTKAEVLPELFSSNYDSEIWEELGDRCLGCGVCTIVCPTCYCFNVLDEVDFSLSAGTRYRVWDSCQLDEFALTASGVNFRSSQAQRQRHRFFRKYKYQTEAHGIVGCVGCGRCSKDCIVDISPVEVINQLHQQTRVSVNAHRGDQT